MTTDYLPEHLENRQLIELKILRIIIVHIPTGLLLHQPVQVTRLDGLSVKLVGIVTEISED